MVFHIEFHQNGLPYRISPKWSSMSNFTKMIFHIEFHQNDLPYRISPKWYSTSNFTKIGQEPWTVRVETHTLNQNMTVNEPIFTKVALSQLFLKNSYTEFHEHPTNSLVANTRHRQTDEQTRSPWIYLVKGLTFNYDRTIDNTGT